MLGDASVTTNIRCQDIKKQQQFYGEVLGLKTVERLPNGEVELEAGKGTRVHLYPGERTKAEHTLASFQVRDIESEIKSLEARGVTFEDYDRPDFKTVNHIATSPVGKCAWFRDPEGNYLCITQHN